MCIFAQLLWITENNTLTTAYRLVWWMMWVVSIWLLCVLLIMCLNQVLGLGIKVEVQITLLATTTLNVLGLANIILNGLFNHVGRRRRRRDNN